MAQPPEETPELRKLREKARGRQHFMHAGQKVYEWEQQLDDVHLYFELPPGAQASHLAIKILPRKLEVGLKGNPPFLSEATASLVDTDESFWMIEDGELHVQLGKARRGETWPCALQGHGQLDAFTEQEVNKQLMLERFAEENPGFDFSGAEFNGMAPSARTFMGGISYGSK